MITGVIEVFDERRGYGFVRSDAHEQFYFHCVDIADGSRTVAVGAPVVARRVVGRVGRDEVVEVVVRG